MPETMPVKPSLNAPPIQKNLTRSSLAEIVVLCTALLILMLVTLTPIYIYYANPWEATYNKQHIEGNVTSDAACQSHQEVPASVLNVSECKSFFPTWGTISGPTTKNISVSGCGNYVGAERDLKSVLGLAIANGVPSSCVSGLKPLICHYVYKDCGDRLSQRSSLVNYRLCLEINTSKCALLKRYWEFLGNILKGADHCLRLPNCNDYFGSDTFQDTSPTQDSVSENPDSQCQSPLVKTSTKSEAFPEASKCSPPCAQSEWKTSVSSGGYYSALLLSVIIGWCSLIITFFTWFNSPKLFDYHTITSFLIAVGFSVFMIAPTIAVVLSPDKTYCKHGDLVGSWEDPTDVCNVQGFLAHFGFISSLIWWLSSVYNTLVAIWRVTLDTQKEKRKLVFVIQLTLSIVVPACLATASLTIGGRYSTSSVFTVTCSSPTLELFFYTFLLPSNIIIFSGTVMSSLVIYKLYQAKRSHQKLLQNNKRSPVYKAYSLIQRRFLLLSLVMPLCFSFIMATIAIYLRTNASSVLLKSFIQYAACVNDPSQSYTVEQCREDLIPTIGPSIAMVNLFLADFVIFALTAYCLMPKDARQFWVRARKRVASCVTKSSGAPTDIEMTQTTQTPDGPSRTETLG